MSQLKVNTIRHTGASSDAVTLASDGTCTAQITNRSNRNLIINGDMRIAVRGSTSNDEDGYKHIDRWRVSCGSDGASITTSQETDSPADFVNSLKYTCTSAAGSTANSSTFNQFIEGQNIAHLNWGSSDAKAVTLSFWVKCSVANIVLGGVLRNSAYDMTYPFTYTTNGTANTWTKYTITIPGPTSGTWLTTNGLGIDVGFNLGSASARLATVNTWANSIARGPTGASSLTTVVNSTFFLTGVQLEVGDVATDFEHRSYSDELARCQRYYYKHIAGNNLVVCLGFSSATNQVSGYIQFPTTMRATPSIDHTNGDNYYRLGAGNLGGDKYVDGAWALQGATDQSTRIYATPQSTLTAGEPGLVDTTNASASMAFSAEL